MEGDAKGVRLCSIAFTYLRPICANPRVSASNPFSYPCLSVCIRV